MTRKIGEQAAIASNGISIMISLSALPENLSTRAGVGARPLNLGVEEGDGGSLDMIVRGPIVLVANNTGEFLR